MNEGETTEVADPADDASFEVPLIFELSLFIPVFAVVVFFLQRLMRGPGRTPQA